MALNSSVVEFMFILGLEFLFWSVLLIIAVILLNLIVIVLGRVYFSKFGRLIFEIQVL